MSRGGIGSIAFRRAEPPIPKPMSQLIGFLRRYQVMPARDVMPLIERIHEPERVLGLIAAAKQVLPDVEPMASAAPAVAASSSAVDASVPNGPRGLQRILLGIPWGFGVFLFLGGAVYFTLSVTADGPHIFNVIPLAFATLGALAVTTAVARARLARRLRTAGVATRGTISHLADANMEINDVPMWVAIYRYRTADGRELTGFTQPAPRTEVSRWAPGDEIDIRYDPTEPGRSIALDDA
jgi:hypothetical protein